MKSGIITINREYASGGHLIGEKTSKILGIPFYDSEIVKEVAKETGLSEDLVANEEQKITSSFLYNLVMNMDRKQNYIEKIYKAEKEIILKKASEGPCVIVGRCANFILQKDIGSLRVFIYADKKHRMDFAIKNYGISKDKVLSTLQRYDSQRAIYSKNMLDKTWGKRTNYDIMLNSGVIGIDYCSQIIAEIYKKNL